LGPRSRAVLIEKVDLVEAGIIDPIKVARLALENAVSVAGPAAHRNHHDRSARAETGTGGGRA
jgi:chaperonin GroEL (HSP60 family)